MFLIDPFNCFLVYPCFTNSLLSSFTSKWNNNFWFPRRKFRKHHSSSFFSCAFFAAAPRFTCVNWDILFRKFYLMCSNTCSFSYCLLSNSFLKMFTY